MYRAVRSTKQPRFESYSRDSENSQENSDDVRMHAGSLKDIDEKDRLWLDALADATFAELSQIFPDFHYTLDSVSSVKVQIVSGKNYKLELNASKNGKIEKCKLQIHIQSWTGTINTTFTCNNTDYNIASKVTKSESRRRYS